MRTLAVIVLAATMTGCASAPVIGIDQSNTEITLNESDASYTVPETPVRKNATKETIEKIKKLKVGAAVVGSEDYWVKRKTGWRNHYDDCEAKPEIEGQTQTETIEIIAADVQNGATVYNNGLPANHRCH